jgi:Nif-specific regulatory protein
MPTPNDTGFDAGWDRIQAEPAMLVTASRLIGESVERTDAAQFLADATAQIRGTINAQWVAVVIPRRGKWSTLAESGEGQSLPESLLGETLDQERPCQEGNWTAAPLAARGESQELLLVLNSDIAPSQVDSLAAATGHAVAGIRRRYQRQRRIRRLETILKISNEWNKTRETEPLLVQMAEAATKLLVADRASIFLWDRANKTLVGRPALGVEGGELRIAHDMGVVGQVVQTGEPQRVDRKDAAKVVDRQVDEQLGYATENLLCVPLRSAGGELFGAFEVINKLEGDFTDEDESGLIELAAHAATALENTQELEQLVRVNRRLVDEAAEAVQMIGHSPPIEALRSTIRRIADTDLAVLIMGENGTGKEVASQQIHYLSRRRDQPFVAVNCAAIPETLLESELFGHEKGAFTDARETRIGKFELAATGTLFLDEIGDLSPGGQAKLLRVLDEKIVVRVGGSTPIRTDARIIAATNQDLADMVSKKEFREDLYFRLNVVTLELPPLRDRGDDIVLLAEHFLMEFSRKAGRKTPKLMAAARKRLRGYSWPGNIRELRNLVERLVYLTSSDTIDEDDLQFVLAPRQTGPSEVPDDLVLGEATNRFQQEYIKRAIDRSGSSMSEAAKRLGLHRSNLYRKMRQLDMTTDE